MAVVAPAADIYGAAIDAQIAMLSALVTTNANPKVEYQLQQQLNAAQVQAVDHYMVTFWLAPSYVLANFSAPAWDNVGQTLTARVAFLQNLFNNAPAPPTGNANGYGGSGWVTVAQNYALQLYAAQISLVEHLMDLPGGTSAATILATLTGYQSQPFEYVFNSVGYTDAWIDD
jgi:hypothetical protein